MDVETTACITSEFSSMTSIPAESSVSSSLESNSSSLPQRPESDSESNSDLESSLLSRKIPPKRHADDAETLELNKPKRSRTETNSSICIALQKKGPPMGILRFFHKATEEEHQAFLSRSLEEIQSHAEDVHNRELHHALHKKNKERRQARERKRTHRVRMRKIEIAAGLRSPGGKKRQV